MSDRVPFYRRLLQFQLRTLLVAIFVIAMVLTQVRGRKQEQGVPIDWKPGKLPRNGSFGTGVPPQSKNIRWSAPLGWYTYGSPVVHRGRVFIGTNNTHGYLQRYPVWLDCGCLLCFDDRDGTLLWQATSPKLSVGREQDYPMYGVTSSPVVAGDRCWYVNNRAEVVCLDVEGFHDGENDGPVIDEPPERRA